MLSPDKATSEQLNLRWADLVALVREEFSSRNQDAGAVFTPKRNTLELRACLNPSASSPEWITLTLSEHELLNADLSEVAAGFYRLYRDAVTRGL